MQRFLRQVGGKLINGLDALPVHIMQRALDRLCLQHLSRASCSQAGSEWMPILDSYLVIAKLDLDDESLDHDPGRLDILPSERVK